MKAFGYFLHRLTMFLVVVASFTASGMLLRVGELNWALLFFFWGFVSYVAAHLIAAELRKPVVVRKSIL